MELKAALKGVLSLLRKDKDKSVFNKVRFVSNPSGVFITDGVCSSFIYVNSDIIDCLVDCSIVEQAIKDKGNLALDYSDKNGFVRLFSEYNTYYLECLQDNYPLPIFPKSDYIFQSCDLCKLNNIIFSASKTSKDKGFPYIHFTSKYIEATDGNRLSRLYMDFPYDNLVIPIDLFSKWPKKLKVNAVYKDDYFLYFMLNNEIRSVVVSERKYPDTTIATQFKEDSYCGVLRKELLDIIKQATNVSDVKGVLLDFTKINSLSIKALGSESISDCYIGDVPILASQFNLLTSIGLNGTLFQQCLSHLKCDSIKLYYNKYPEPLLIKGDNTYMYIWPMVNE